MVHHLKNVSYLHLNHHQHNYHHHRHKTLEQNFHSNIEFDWMRKKQEEKKIYDTLMMMTTTIIIVMIISSHHHHHHHQKDDGGVRYRKKHLVSIFLPYFCPCLISKTMMLIIWWPSSSSSTMVSVVVIIIIIIIKKLNLQGIWTTFENSMFSIFSSNMTSVYFVWPKKNESCPMIIKRKKKTISKVFFKTEIFPSQKDRSD